MPPKDDPRDQLPVTSLRLVVVILSGVARAFAFARSAGTRSRRTSLRFRHGDTLASGSFPVGAQHRGPQRAAFACWGGSILCPANILGVMLPIHADRRASKAHVECGGLPPLFAGRACPVVLLASPGNVNLPIGAFGFPPSRGEGVRPLRAVILPALTKEGSGVARVFALPRSAGPRSQRTSLRCCRGSTSLIGFVGAR